MLFQSRGAGGARGAMAPPIFWGKIHIDFKQDRRLHERLLVTRKILKNHVYPIKNVVEECGESGEGASVNANQILKNEVCITYRCARARLTTFTLLLVN